MVPGASSPNVYQHLSNNHTNANVNDTGGEVISLSSISSHHDDSESSLNLDSKSNTSEATLTGKPGAQGDTEMTVVEYADEVDAENDTSITDETASLLGAPVEKVNPLGRQVTLLSCVMLNLGQMLGSGIFSVPGVVLNSVGSTGLFFLIWLLAPLFSFAALAVYTELASMFPNRSGAEVVYLEQAYPRPRFLVPVSFAVTTVLLSFSATNSIIFAQYAMTLFETTHTSGRQTILAIAVATFAVAVVAISTKWSLRIVNAITFVKVISQIFVAATGLAVLAGLTRIQDPFANFSNPWSGSTSNGNAFATAFVKAHFAFVGWGNAFNVLAEVRSADAVRTVRNAGRIGLFLITALFMLTNVSYVAAIPKEEIKQSGQLVGALFFRKVFGEHWAAKILPLMVVISCSGNIIAVTIGQARVIREVARQGLLPWPEFFASTEPFGTPLGPVLLKYLLTVIVILALPAADAFNFLLDLASYPNLFFGAATTIGLWLLRRRRRSVTKADAPERTEYRAPNLAVVLKLISCIFLIVLPWIPPENGRADVSFWYATYCVVGLGILAICGIYYYVWIVLLPKIGGYEVVEEIEELEGGARLARLVRRRKSGTPGVSDTTTTRDYSEERQLEAHVPLLTGSS